MLDLSGIDSNSLVLDVGCGNGNTTLWIAEQTGAWVTGVDLSGRLIDNANAALVDWLARRNGHDYGLVDFRKASATDLPYPDHRFTHVWSQATFHRIPDVAKAVKEVTRVLRRDGKFILDTLVTPEPTQVTQETRTRCYDRLLCDLAPSFHGYVRLLVDAGLQVESINDWSHHLARSYELLRESAAQHLQEDPVRLGDIVVAYEQMVKAIGNRELGWGCFLSV